MTGEHSGVLAEGPAGRVTGSGDKALCEVGQGGHPTADLADSYTSFGQEQGANIDQYLLSTTCIGHHSFH